MIRHFYHLYADGAWAEPAIEHANALIGFGGQVTVSLVGPSADRRAARARLARELAVVVDWIEADGGSEQATLGAVRAWACSAGDSVVLYAHTKGAHRQSALQSAWRRSMTRNVLGRWRECVDLLRDYDTVGCHWLTSADSRKPGEVLTPYYAGNFWWATAAYLRRLPPVGPTRSGAEGWIGLASPRAYDLSPGWPSEELFAVPKGLASDACRR